MEKIVDASNVEKFIKSAKIERNKDEKCELEVSKTAMGVYRTQYPGYREWKSVPYENSVKSYSDGKKLSEYKGAYLIVNDETGEVLTADILTEIKSPVRKMAKQENRFPKTGEEIVTSVLNGEIKFKDERIRPYIHVFANVYYWVGNMLPVWSNPLGLSDRGTWRNKIMFLNGERPSETETNLEKAWGDWNLPNDWKSGFLLQDMFDGERVKLFCKESAEVYLPKNAGFNYHSQWFLNNAKLIIQRSYRIAKPDMKGWDDNRKDGTSHATFVKKTFEKLFREAGIEFEENPNLLELF